MYDKVKFWIDRAIVGEQYPTIVNYLDDANTQTNHRTGETKIFGCLDGLKVSIFLGGISVVGSLPKFLYGGCNVYTLNRHTTAQAIEKIGDALHIQMSDVKVTSIEFGTTFVMKNNVQSYLSKLGNMPNLKRYQLNEPSTLYYRGKGKQQSKMLIFYDKAVEAKEKRIDLPEVLKDANLLRYEMRWDGRLSKQLGMSEIKASTLTEKTFYSNLMKRYQESYFSITKHKQIKTNIMSEIKSTTQAFEVFVARLISQTDPTQINGFLDELKEAKVFNDRKYYTRLKQKIERIATKANLTMSDELIKELDDDVKNCGAYV
ncbi:MAG: hypothetical protein J6Y78_05625 [Paludibacteraceae bacterium]|nr:hypothetical protein [Paludibacteraceae bacterium]